MAASAVSMARAALAMVSLHIGLVVDSADLVAEWHERGPSRTRAPQELLDAKP